MKGKPLTVVEWLVFFGLILFMLAIALFALRAVGADGVPEANCDVLFPLPGAGPSARIEFRRFRVLSSGLDGGLDPGFASAVGISTCDVSDVRDRSGEIVGKRYACWINLPGADRHWHYQCRECGDTGCGAWKDEERVSCTNPSGSDCPLFPEATP